MDTTLPPHPKFGRDDQGNLWLNFGTYGQQIEVACFTVDGSRLLTVRKVGLAQIWDTNTGQLIGQIRPDSPLAGSDRAPTSQPSWHQMRWLARRIVCQPPWYAASE